MIVNAYLIDDLPDCGDDVYDNHQQSRGGRDDAAGRGFRFPGQTYQRPSEVVCKTLLLCLTEAMYIVKPTFWAQRILKPDLEFVARATARAGVADVAPVAPDGYETDDVPTPMVPTRPPPKFEKLQDDAKRIRTGAAAGETKVSELTARLTSVLDIVAPLPKGAR